MKIFQNVLAFFKAPFFLLKIIRIRRKDEVLIAIPPKFGDMVYGMMFAKQYKVETGKKIAVFCSERYKKYVENYSCVDRIVTYKGTSGEKYAYFHAVGIGYFFKRSHFGNGKIIYAAPPPYFFKNKNVVDIYTEDIFKLKNKNCELLNIKTDIKIKSIENFEENKNRIVVLNSFSDSYVKECSSFFKKIAEILNSKGYLIYSNVVGDQKPVENTIALRCPIEELYFVCQKAKAFITVRSGVLDFVLATKCQKLIIYMKKNAFKYHSVEQFNSNIKEFEIYDKQKESQFLNMIEKTF